MRARLFAVAGAAFAAFTAVPAHATSLDDAIALALQHDPGLKRAQAEQDAAHARVRQADAGRLPSVVLSGSAGQSETDFGHFFGFGRYSLTPATAQIAVTQPLFGGGGVSAAIDQAKAGDTQAAFNRQNVRATLIADVVTAYVAVRTAQAAVALEQKALDEYVQDEAQAQRRFQDGEVSITDVDQAAARRSAARADVARGQGDLAQAQARYRALVGEDPAALDPPGPPPDTPANLDDALAAARDHNPGVAAAGAALRAAEFAVRRARAEGGPSLSLVAEASTTRDQFLPGYRASGVSVGVQGHWALFSGGLVSGKVEEAQAGVRSAQATLDQARAASDEATIDAWQARRTTDALADAAADQAKASAAALDSVRNEVRVGTRPQIDLLDAERDALSANVGVLQAEGARIVAAYRLKAAIGD